MTRLALAVVVVLAVVGAALYGVHSSKHGTSAPTVTVNRDGFPGNFNGGEFGVADGMKPAEVLHRFGSPATKSEGCWVYPIRNATFAGYATERSYDAVRFCFLEGVVSRIEDHAQGRWDVPEYVSKPACPSLYGAESTACTRN